MPTRVASGLRRLTSSSCSFTGFASEVPVALPPGASRLSTRSAETGSVTAVNRIGTSVMAWRAAWAVGVAIARTRSRSAEANVPAIEAAVDWSPWAFCSSQMTL